MGRPMRLIFMGSPDFAVPCLDRLVTDGHTVALVATQPDRPAGRGRDLRPPPVKLAAARHRLPLTQPERLNDPVTVDTLRAIAPEIIVVVAFGQFLPRAVRELPPLGCINVHASLLPKYRGAAPIHRAVMAGETETGVTIMRVEGRMDAGPILLQRTCPILPEDDTGILHDRLAALGAEALSDALRILATGSGTWIPQDETRVSAAPKLGDADCRLEFAGPAAALVNQHPRPVADARRLPRAAGWQAAPDPQGRDTPGERAAGRDPRRRTDRGRDRYGRRGGGLAGGPAGRQATDGRRRVRPGTAAPGRNALWLGRPRRSLEFGTPIHAGQPGRRQWKNPPGPDESPWTCSSGSRPRTRTPTSSWIPACAPAGWIAPIGPWPPNWCTASCAGRADWTGCWPRVWIGPWPPWIPWSAPCCASESISSPV